MTKVMIRDLKISDSLLFFQKLSFTAYIAAVTLGGYVLANGFHGFAGNNFGTNGSLNGHVELLAWNQLLQLFAHAAAKAFGIVDM
jgi:hypothetical protein